jgi:hypothetical protein
VRQDLKVRPELQEQRAQQEHQALKVRPELQARRGGLVRRELPEQWVRWDFKGRRVRRVRRELPEQLEQTGVALIFGTHSIRARVTRSMMW